MTAREAAAALEQRVADVLRQRCCPDDVIGEVLAVVVDGAADVAAAVLVDQTALAGMSVEEGAAELDLRPPRELVIAWVHAARQMLGDAPNYAETRIDFPGVSMDVHAAGEPERYVFTVQRAGRLTPHEARRAAEAERDRLSDQVDAVIELCEDAMRPPTATDPRPASHRLSPRAVLTALGAWPR